MIDGLVHFYLQRNDDESGVSGTGKVAAGVIFPNGKAVMSWLTPTSSIALYDSIQDVKTIHGHGGKTLVMVRISNYRVVEVEEYLEIASRLAEDDARQRKYQDILDRHENMQKINEDMCKAFKKEKKDEV